MVVGISATSLREGGKVKKIYLGGGFTHFNCFN